MTSGSPRGQDNYDADQLMHLGNWQLDTVSGGNIMIDGGVLYGIVPRTLWEKVTPPDQNNRLQVRVNCVLARDGRHTVLVDTGYGGKLMPLERDFWGLQAGEPLLESLATLGVAPDQIDLVVLSHLHFDHVGGATRLDGRTPVLTFPRAQYVVGRIEWEDAISRAPEVESAYSMENLTPLQESGQLTFIEDGATIVPGLRARLTGGHTRGHMALEFESNRAGALYLSDLCPTTAHLRRMWCLAYDTCLLDTRRVKPQLLAEAVDREWFVLWPHDPELSAGRLVRHPKRDFLVVDPRPRL